MTWVPTDEERERWPNFAALADKHGDPVTHAIGAFIEWLNGESGYTLAEYVEEDEWGNELIFPRLVPVNRSEEWLLCEYYGVDHKAYRREREEAQREALEAQRKLNAEMRESWMRVDANRESQG